MKVYLLLKQRNFTTFRIGVFDSKDKAHKVMDKLNRQDIDCFFNIEEYDLNAEYVTIKGIEDIV
jgi:hypothetical protein